MKYLFMKKNENGFALVSIALIILVVGVITSTGYLLYRHNKTKKNAGTQTTQSAVSQDTISKSEPGTLAGKYVLSTYTSAKNGYSMLVPKEINESYGSCRWEKERDSYGPINAWTPTKVFEGGEKVYISVE